MEQWWLLGGDRQPVGPLTTDLVLAGIVQGSVSPDSLVCVVGGTEWQALEDVGVFSTAALEASDPEEHPSTLPPPAGARRARKLLELEERTIVDGIPLWPADSVSEVEPATSTLRQHLAGLEEGEERTIVDSPFRPSDPPK